MCVEKNVLQCKNYNNEMLFFLCLSELSIKIKWISQLIH